RYAVPPRWQIGLQPAVPLWKVIVGFAPTRLRRASRPAFFYSDNRRTDDRRRISVEAAQAASVLRRLLFRGSARGDDLIGLLAGQFLHVIELEGEGADAGGRRAHLDDEVADFRLRHQRLDHVPARPSLARVEAEDLATPPRQDRVDFGGRLRRADD